MRLLDFIRGKGMTSDLAHPDRGFKWTILAFAAAGFLVAALVVWQLNETSPARWCALAAQTSAENTSACFNVLLKLLDIKDHSVIGLLIILGITVISVVVVALGVKVTGAGPGGLSVDIGADKTTVTSEGGQTVQVATPPPAE